MVLGTYLIVGYLDPSGHTNFQFTYIALRRIQVDPFQCSYDFQTPRASR